MQYAKAIVAALISGFSVYGTALTDGHVTMGEWVGIAGATLVAAGATWAVPNKPKGTT